MKKTLLALTITTLLSACGGGGGGSSTPAPTPTPTPDPVVTPEKTATNWIFHKHKSSSRTVNARRPSTHVYDLAVLDVNNDGYNDVVFGGPLYGNGGWEEEAIPLTVLVNNQDHVMINKPAEMFGEGNSIPAQVHTRAISQADFDMNGVDDLIMIGHGWDSDPFPGEPLQLIMNEGDHWVDKSGDLNHDYATFYHGGTVIDANGDGYPDILANSFWGAHEDASQNSNSVLLINDGNGMFTSDSNYLSDLQRDHWTLTVVSGDLNADSCEDLIYTGFENVIFWNKCSDNGFTGYSDSTQLPAFEGEWNMATDATIADINNDGHNDVLLAWTNDYNGRAVQILINDGYGEFEDQTKEFLTTHLTAGKHEWIGRIYVEDLDLDGDNDMILFADNMHSGATAILENVDGIYTPLVENMPGTLFPFDADNDGDLDLLSVDRSTGYSVLENLTIK